MIMAVQASVIVKKSGSVSLDAPLFPHEGCLRNCNLFTILCLY